MNNHNGNHNHHNHANHKINDCIHYAEDDKEPVGMLLRLRVPSLIIGLLLGLLLSFVVSMFEEVLSRDIRVAFFIPLIVYLAAAIGAQTQNIYVRDLKTGHANFKTYLFKESVLGILLGLICALLTTAVVIFWLDTPGLVLTVFLGVFGAILPAPIIALIITELLQLEREDPAVWAGPIATVFQDTVSVLIYGLIASAIIL